MQNSSYKERGVVLHSTKYGEGQLIVHLLTATHGRHSYITRLGRSTARSSNVGATRSLFQPLFLVQFEAQAGRGDLHKMAQVESHYTLSELPFNIVKSSIAMFMSELIYRLTGSGQGSGQEPEDGQLYDFIEGSVVALDALVDGVSNFHLHFMVRLTHYLGYGPSNNWQQEAWFDIKKGCYTTTQPTHLLTIEPQLAEIINTLNNSSIAQLKDIKLHQSQRVQVMDSLVDYYRFHTQAICSVRSIKILGELF